MMIVLLIAGIGAERLQEVAEVCSGWCRVSLGVAGRRSGEGISAVRRPPADLDPGSGGCERRDDMARVDCLPLADRRLDLLGPVPPLARQRPGGDLEHDRRLSQVEGDDHLDLAGRERQQRRAGPQRPQVRAGSAGRQPEYVVIREKDGILHARRWIAQHRHHAPAKPM